MTGPTFGSVDEVTGDLLDLLADDGTLRTEDEWDLYVAALHKAAVDGIVRPNRLRELVRGQVKPNRVGAFTRRALLSGLLTRTGDYELSDDVTSRNRGRPVPLMRLRP